jgi:hypothetical protein
MVVAVIRKKEVVASHVVEGVGKDSDFPEEDGRGERNCAENFIISVVLSRAEESNFIMCIVLGKELVERVNSRRRR